MGIITLRKVQGKQAPRVELGRMYFFRYIPKDLDTLGGTYYDRYPMVFVTKRRKDYFEGINYHHLLIKRRIFLFETMTKYFTDNPIEEDTTLFWRKFRRVIFKLRTLKAGEVSFRKYKRYWFK